MSNMPDRAPSVLTPTRHNPRRAVVCTYRPCVTPTGAAGIVGLLAVAGILYLLWQRHHGGDGYYEDDDVDDEPYDDEGYEVTYRYEYYEETWRDD